MSCWKATLVGFHRGFIFVSERAKSREITATTDEGALDNGAGTCGAGIRQQRQRPCLAVHTHQTATGPSTPVTGP